MKFTYAHLIIVILVILFCWSVVHASYIVEGNAQRTPLSRAAPVPVSRPAPRQTVSASARPSASVSRPVPPPQRTPVSGAVPASIQPSASVSQSALARQPVQMSPVPRAAPITLSYGLDATHKGADTSGYADATYTNRIVEMQKMIDVLSNPNKTPLEKVDYLLSTETPFKLRKDPQLEELIDGLQSCIKSYIDQIIVANAQVRKKRPVRRHKFDQKNICRGTECVRYDQADKIAKYFDDNSGDFMKQLKYIMSPDFVMRDDPDYTNLLGALQKGCIHAKLRKINIFTKGVYRSWIENDSSNLAIIQCKGKDMFTAECAERAKNNAINAPKDIAMNTQNAKTRPIPRAVRTENPPTLQANPALRGLSANNP